MVINQMKTMKNKNIFIGMLIGFLSVTFIACEDNIDPLVEELDFWNSTNGNERNSSHSLFKYTI